MKVGRLRSVWRRITHELYRSLYDQSRGDRVLVLLTVPRSGSTWSMDLLRTHPQIDMHPRCHVHTALGLRGRRYPRDLSNGPDATTPIEVRPHQWEQIPDLRLSRSRHIGGERIDVEKIHPHFFDHDVTRFVDRIRQLSTDRPLTIIYQVRDPRETLVSFLEYQRRNPSWEGRSPTQISRHVRQVFESLRAVHQHIPGPVVEYERLKESPGRVLSDLLMEITGVSPNDLDIEEALHATRREKKQNLGSPFVGATSSDDLTCRYKSYFAEHETDIEAMYAAYGAVCS